MENRNENYEEIINEIYDETIDTILDNFTRMIFSTTDESYEESTEYDYNNDSNVNNFSNFDNFDNIFSNFSARTRGPSVRRMSSVFTERYIPDSFDRRLNQILEETFTNQSVEEKDDERIIKVNEQKYLTLKDKEKYDKQCCICLEEFKDECVVTLLDKCNHIVHKDCVIEWGKYKTSCPICRNNIE